jgi:pSer/pThr/pTyr-binding forkhead associated (FHA) protein
MLALQLLRITENNPGINGPPAVAIERFPCVVGRHSTCDRRLADPEISRRHCMFSLREGRIWVEDLGSLNGTRLNGKPLAGAWLLADGDRLELGTSSFLVRLAEGPAEESVDLGAAPPDTEDPTRRNLTERRP